MTINIESTSGNKMEKKMVFEGILKAQEYLNKVGVSKGLDVSTGKSSYKARGIDGVMNAVSSAFVSAGIFLMPSYEVISREIIETKTQYGDKIAEKINIKGTFYFIAGDGSESPRCTIEASAINNTDKGAQIAMSYCLKYFLAQSLAIPFEGLQEEGETQNPEIVKKEKKKIGKEEFFKRAEEKGWIKIYKEIGRDKFFGKISEYYDFDEETFTDFEDSI